MPCDCGGQSRNGTAQSGVAPTKTRAKRSRAKKSVAKSTPRPKGETEAKTVADRIVLRDGKELLGQVDESSNDGMLTILARREMVRKTLPDWATTWEDAEKDANAMAARQRRERLAGWRRERPPESAPGDRITAWLDRELARSAGPVTPSTLMAIRLDRDDVSAVERRSDSAAQALRAAWVLGLANPETTPLATLKDSIAGRGMILANDDPIAVDRLLPPYAERADHWMLRRAATEVLYDEGLRFIGFGSTILSEPMPGQPIDPATGVKLVEGTIRDVLGVGRHRLTAIETRRCRRPQPSGYDPDEDRNRTRSHNRLGRVDLILLQRKQLGPGSLEVPEPGSRYRPPNRRDDGRRRPASPGGDEFDRLDRSRLRVAGNEGTGLGRGDDRWRGCGSGANRSDSIADGTRLRCRGQGVGPCSTDHASIGLGQAIISPLINGPRACCSTIRGGRFDRPVVTISRSPRPSVRRAVCAHHANR